LSIARNTFAINCKRPTYLMTLWITSAMGGYPESPVGFRYALGVTLGIIVASLIRGAGCKMDEVTLEKKRRKG
jgi:hypothetical protein